MPRRLIVVQHEPFDFGEIKEEIETIAEHFSAYLSEFRGQRETGSKYAIMGPVSKVLDKAKGGDWGMGDLMGYGIRVHEMTSERGYLSPTAHDNLRAGIEGLLALMDRVPLSARDRVVEHVGHHVYYLRRKSLLEYLEAKRREFIQFLRSKYADDRALQEAWGEDRVTFETVRYPGPSQRQKANPQKASDIAEFWKVQKEEPIIEEEEELE